MSKRIVSPAVVAGAFMIFVATAANAGPITTVPTLTDWAEIALCGVFALVGAALIARKGRLF